MKQIPAVVLIMLLLVWPGVIQAEGPKVVVHAMGGAEWMPYYKYPLDVEGENNGLFIDLLDTLFEKELGMKVERLYLPWKRAQQAVEVGDADFMITIPTPDREKYALTTVRPLHKMFLHLYTYADHPMAAQIAKVRTAEDIKALDLKLAAHIGDGWYKAHIASKGIRTNSVREDEHIVKFVAAKRADGMIDALLPTNRTIFELNLQSKITLTDVRFGPMNFHVLIGRKSPLALRLGEINEAILRMHGNGTIQRLEAKYDQMRHR